MTIEELKFCNKFIKQADIVFDVGCRVDSHFTKFSCEVHYFDPVHKFIDNLQSQKNANTKSYFNKFGLGEEEKELYYYPRYQSFFDRVLTQGISDKDQRIKLNIKKGKDYINKNNIKKIDFLKIDTEGYELNVLKGIEDELNIVKCVQFEYGGTYRDSNVKLNDVISYLKQYSFTNFYYINQSGLKELENYEDHYQYANIACFKREVEYANKVF